MSEKCLYCSTPIEQKEGKRERKFCSPSHCTMYNLNLKKKDKPKGKQGRPKGSPNKNKVVGTVPLPDDYVEFTEVKIAGVEGKTLTYPAFEMKPLEEMGSEMNAIALPEPQPKWDFSQVVFLNVEDFTEYPKKDCPPNRFQRTEYLSKKKEADDKIREAFNQYKK